MVKSKAAKSPKSPTGLFTSMDREAIGLYPILERRGLQPGRDVRIIGCNNEYNLAMLSPRPASIDIGAEEMAKWAVFRLTQRINFRAPSNRRCASLVALSKKLDSSAGESGD